MRKSLLLLPLLALAACVDGYYDANGNFHYADGSYYDANGVYYTSDVAARPYGARAPYMAPAPAVSETVVEGYDPVYDADTTTTRTTVTTYGYVKAGYYDANGYYIAPGYGPSVPTKFMPPAGMCRIWYPNRPVRSQPGVAPCESVRVHVPAGAYVVYGG